MSIGCAGGERASTGENSPWGGKPRGRLSVKCPFIPLDNDLPIVYNSNGSRDVTEVLMAFLSAASSAGLMSTPGRRASQEIVCPNHDELCCQRGKVEKQGGTQ